MLTISLHSGYGVIWTYLLQDKKILFLMLLVENIIVYSSLTCATTMEWYNSESSDLKGDNLFHLQVSSKICVLLSIAASHPGVYS